MVDTAELGSGVNASFNDDYFRQDQLIHAS
jgi:hypothetical protein